MRVALRETDAGKTLQLRRLWTAAVSHHFLGWRGSGGGVPNETGLSFGLGTTSHSKITVDPKSVCVSINIYCIRN